MAGAGAIGGLLGASLSAAGTDVTLLGRPALADAVARQGLQVTGHTEFQGPLPVVVGPDAGPYDVVFVTCKAHATAALAPQVAPLLAPGGSFVSLQNGLGNAEILAGLVAPEQVVVAITSHGVSVEAPGRLHHAGRGQVRVGPAPGHAPAQAVDRVVRLLEATGLGAEAVHGTAGHLWLKGAVNAGINPLCALCGTPNGGLREVWDEAKGLVDEVVALSRAAGVRLPADALEALDQTVTATAENRCSMLQDVQAQRPTEIEQITGYFMRVARRLGYPLFANEDIYRRLKALEASYLGEEVSHALTKRAARAFRWSPPG